MRALSSPRCARSTWSLLCTPGVVHADSAAPVVVHAAPAHANYTQPAVHAAPAPPGAIYAAPGAFYPRLQPFMCAWRHPRCACSTWSLLCKPGVVHTAPVPPGAVPAAPAAPGAVYAAPTAPEAFYAHLEAPTPHLQMCLPCPWQIFTCSQRDLQVCCVHTQTDAKMPSPPQPVWPRDGNQRVHRAALSAALGTCCTWSLLCGAWSLLCAPRADYSRLEPSTLRLGGLQLRLRCLEPSTRARSCRR